MPFSLAPGSGAKKNWNPSFFFFNHVVNCNQLWSLSHNFHPAAMALVESQAAFKQRCDELSSDGTLHTAMGREGIVTLSGLAFVLGTPQVAPAEAQFDAFAKRAGRCGSALFHTFPFKFARFILSYPIHLSSIFKLSPASSQA